MLGEDSIALTGMFERVEVLDADCECALRRLLNRCPTSRNAELQALCGELPICWPDPNSENDVAEDAQPVLLIDKNRPTLVVHFSVACCHCHSFGREGVLARGPALLKVQL